MRKPKQQLKVFLLIVLFWMSCGVLLGQNPLVKQWDKRFGGTGSDGFRSFDKTKNGGFILGGSSNSDSSGDKTTFNCDTFDYWIVMVDGNGIKQFDKRFGSLANEDLKYVSHTNDGGFIIGGYTDSDTGCEKSQHSWGSFDYWIVKADSVGNKEWDKRFGGDDYEALGCLKQTSDGGYIIGGSSRSGISGDKTQPNWGIKYNYWIIKIDSNGFTQWDKRFGGGNNDFLFTLIQTNDGGYLLGGGSSSDAYGDKSQDNWDGSGQTQDYWIVKVDSIGNKQWDKRYGGSDTDCLYSAVQTTDNGYILAGCSYSGLDGDKTENNWDTTLLTNDYWIVKVDSIGTKQWDKVYGGRFKESYLFSIAQTTDSGYLISGTSSSDISGDKTENNLAVQQGWIVKTDNSGMKQWDKTIFTSDMNQFSHTIELENGCYIIASQTAAGIGGYKTQSSWGGSDFWIIKFYDSTQVNLPATSLSSTDTNFCEIKCIDFFDLSTNNPTSWQWFFPGADSTTSTLQNPTNICYNNYGSFDVTLIACNAAGCDTLYLPGFINEYQTLTPVITQSNDTLFSSPGVAYQWWSVDSGIITGATNNYYIPTQGGSYYVIVTDSNGCNGASNTIIITALNSPLERGWGCVITPNPNNGSFTISFNEVLHKDFSLRILNSIGQTINNCQWSIVNGQKAIVNLPNAAPGLYAVEVITREKVYRQKFVLSTTLPK